MRRKDYKLIAQALFEAKPASQELLARSVWSFIVTKLKSRFHDENPSFNAERFVRQCEKGVLK